MKQLTVEFATATDDCAIRSLMQRTQMPGRVTLAFEREPSFSLGCAVTGEDARIIVARDDANGEVVGVACRSVRRVFLNGREQRIGYLGHLRIAEGYQGRWLLSRGFSILSKLHHQDPVPGYLVSIIDENWTATGVLVSKPRKGFPILYPVSDFMTVAVDVSASHCCPSAVVEIRPGTTELLPAVVRFLHDHGRQRQFFSVWDEGRLLALSAFGLRVDDLRIALCDGNVVGVMALWDQSSYKQTVIRSYSGWLKVAVPLLNFSTALLGRNSLPMPGERLSSAYASLACVANDDANVFAALFESVRRSATARGVKFLLLGISPLDPLFVHVRSYGRFFYPSKFYFAEWPDGSKLHEQLDARPTYLDIATL